MIKIILLGFVFLGATKSFSLGGEKIYECSIKVDWCEIDKDNPFDCSQKHRIMDESFSTECPKRRTFSVQKSNRQKEMRIDMACSTSFENLGIAVNEIVTGSMGMSLAYALAPRHLFTMLRFSDDIGEARQLVYIFCDPKP